MESFFSGSSNPIFKLFSQKKALALLAGLAAAVYLAQALLYAHTGPVTMDEGTYLAKGLLYVTGVYRPFQDYGPWTNKMPLAFLIPGAAQALFGPGLRTGRYFAVFLGLLMLAGLWLAARRSAGKTAAVILLWVVALDPAAVSYYSTAISQGIVACLLAWMLAFSLGEGRSLWEIALAAVLASMIVMTRQNLAPVVPFFLLFVFWQHGKRAGLAALAVSVLVLGIFHWMYYPNIFKLWASFLPDALKNWLFPTPAGSTGGTAVPLMAPSLLTGLYVFWEGVRYNLFATVGTLAACFFWPRRSAWASETRFKTSVYLLSLFVFLTGIHLWAAVGKDYCPYCYSGYLAFFSPLALLLAAVSFSSWVRQPGPLRRILAGAAVLLLCAGIGFGSYQLIGGPLASIQVPRIRGMLIQPGSTEIWRLLANKFGWEYDSAQQVLSAAAGLAAGVLIQLAGWALKRTGSKQQTWQMGGILLLLCLGTLISPTSLLAGGKDLTGCGRDVILSHEQAGAYLARTIPTGARVYWQNDLTPLPLLYLLPRVQIYPPQLNHWYNYLKGGDPQKILARGFWNAELRRQWLNEADYVLLADQYTDDWANNQERASQFNELSPTPRVNACEKTSVIHIFQRR